MKIAVCIEGAPSIRPVDRAALEVGMGIRERLAGVRLEVFSVCDGSQLEPLHLARARGADAVHRIVPPREWRGRSATALTLAARLRAGTASSRYGGSDGAFDLVVCGDRSIDEPPASVGPLVAELLQLTAVTAVCRVRERRRESLGLERRLEHDCREATSVQLPALLTTTEDAAVAAYVSHRRLLAARRQPIPAWELQWNGELPGVPRRIEEPGRHGLRMTN